jgi:hypothetical protein
MRNNEIGGDNDLFDISSTNSKVNIKLNDNVALVLSDTAVIKGANNQVLVQQASDFGTIDSSKEYFIDGIVDMGSTSIEIPAGGINLKGYDLEISKLISSEASYTMFTSPAGGSGNYLAQNMAFEVTGAGSQLYDIVGDTGFEAIEVSAVNWNDCTSMGTIDNYRQGLETGTGRFGGSPELTLKGAWVGGYRATTTIVRSLDAGFSGSLFKAGTGFVMASRFLTDINCDLPASASLVDFASANFTNPSTLQFHDCIITRNGVSNASDSNLTPNITSADISSDWRSNQGLPNTFVGGRNTISSESATTISVVSTWYTIAGTWTASELEHYDNPTNGQLRHLGNNPQEFKIEADFTMDGTANNDISVKFIKYDASTTTESDIVTQRRQINSLVGSRDVGFYNIIAHVTLDQNDYVYAQVMNNTGTANVTLENDSFFIISER